MRTFIPFTVALALLLGLAVAEASAVKVSGKVTNKDGKAVAGAQVTLIKAGAPGPKVESTIEVQVIELADKPVGPKPQPANSALTAADGTYTIENVVRGDYTVRANRKDVGSASVKLTVGDKDLVVDLVLEAPKPKTPPKK